MYKSATQRKLNRITNAGNKIKMKAKPTTTPLRAGATYQHPNEFGYYGKFGGAYIPEMLHRNVEELKNR